MSTVKMCEGCQRNPVRSPKARHCATCHMAVAKVKSQLAVYRHRERVKKGKARHNQTYGGKPTASAIQHAIEVLKKVGMLSAA